MRSAEFFPALACKIRVRAFAVASKVRWRDHRAPPRRPYVVRAFAGRAIVRDFRIKTRL